MKSAIPFVCSPLVNRGLVDCGDQRITLWSMRRTLNPTVMVMHNWMTASVPSFALHHWPSIIRVYAVNRDGSDYLLLDATRKGELCFGKGIAEDAPGRFDGNYYKLPMIRDSKFGLKL